MRYDEITPELIELSQKARLLGFPRDKEIGDWIFSVGKVILLSESTPIQTYPPTLILSFSQCLGWLRNRGWSLRDIYQRLDTDGFLFPKPHHEAIAKVVVKILEEECSKKTSKSLLR